MLNLTFRQYIIFAAHRYTNHSPCFTDIQLSGPIPVISKLVFGQAPIVHFLAHLFGHMGIVRDKIEKPFLIVFVLFDDFFSSFVGCIGVIVVHPNEIAAEWAMVVGVSLAIGDQVELFEPLAPT